MKVVFLTVHEAESARKVDFHFWANALSRRRAEIDWLTVGFSPVSLLRSHRRRYKRPYNTWVQVNNSIRKNVWFPIFHPFNLKSPLLNKWTKALFRHYNYLLPRAIIDAFGNVDYFVVENGAGLLLIPSLAQRFPKAKFIYTVCDRIETLDYHPVIEEAEIKALPYFSLIRVPSPVMIEDYKEHSNVRYIPHGIEKALFDAPMTNPYDRPKNIISIGDMLFDQKTVCIMADAFPDWTFHLFGNNARLPTHMDNVIVYGERPFREIIPYVKFADIGLAPYKPAVNADYLSQSSMKMIQYTYCQLPIISPSFASADRAHVISYRPGEKTSIIESVQKAALYPRETIDRSLVLDWDQTIELMFNDNLSILRRSKRSSDKDLLRQRPPDKAIESSL